MLLNEITFEPKCSPKVLKQAKDWLVSSHGAISSAAYYAIFGETGLPEIRNGVCHAGIGATTPPDGRRVCVATHVGEGEKTEAYLQWLVNDSYVSRFILNRDDFEHCRKYGIIVSADIPYQFMINAMIMARHTRELGRTRCFSLFEELVNAGVSGDIAYPFCFNTTISSTSPSGHDGVPVSQGTGGHRVFKLFNIQAFRNFVRGDLGDVSDVRNDPKLHYRNHASIYGGKELFQTSSLWALPKEYKNGYNNMYNDPKWYNTTTHILEELFKEQKFKTLLSEYRREKTEGPSYAPPNPFTKSANPVLKADQISILELKDFVIPYIISEGVLD